MDDDVLRRSVDDLLRTFRDALVCLLPIADKLMMEWRDENQHRDWERIAEALFDSCVRGPIGADANRVDGEFRLPRYDTDITTYKDSSWILVKRGNSDNSTNVLVRVTTRSQPFDCVWVARLDAKTLTPLECLELPFSEVTFSFMRRCRGRTDSEINFIEAVE